MVLDDTGFYSSVTSAATYSERSLIDKVLARRNVEKIETLLRKPHWSREDLSLLLYYLVSDELKLLNLSPWDRYVLGKYFVWVRQIVKVGDLFYDVKEKIKEKMKNMKAPKEKIDERLRRLERIEKQLIEAIRFASDVFLYLARSTLSVKGKAFDQLLRQKIEYEYKTPTPEIKAETKNFLFGGGK